MTDGAAFLLRGDARRIPLADASVDLIVTSPPFYSLRSYTDAGEHYTGQLGSEATPAEFLANLWAATREMVRVLKPSGSMFIELGDKYATSLHSYNYRDPGIYTRKTPQPDGEWSKTGWLGNPNVQRSAQSTGGIPPKSLMGLPWAYALGCIGTLANLSAEYVHRELVSQVTKELLRDVATGWLTLPEAELALDLALDPAVSDGLFGGPGPGLNLILRAEVIWEHTNGLPESVTDRTRRSHSTWFHLVKQPKYYAGIDEIREPHARTSWATAIRLNGGREQQGPQDVGRIIHGLNRGPSGLSESPLGKLPGSVWSVEESIWDGPINFCPRCGRNLTGAGSGPAGRNETVTVSSGSPMSGTDAPTGSPTNSTSDPSLTDSLSTTSAETEDASGPTTLSPSPALRTSPEATTSVPSTPSRHTASTGTSSPQPTRITVREAPESVGCVCETVLGHSGPGSVWSVPSEPLRVPEHLGIDHYAAFPSEWPRRLILGWSPPGICCECGQGRAPVVEREIPDYRDLPQNPRDAGRYEASPVSGGLRSSGLRKPGWRNLPDRAATILGYACACTPYTDHPGTGGSSGPDGRYGNALDRGDGYPNTAMGLGKPGLSARPKVGPWREYHLDGWTPPPTRPAVVLDPFVGTGTVPMVARALGRIGVGLDLSADYLRLATWRIWHSGDHAKAVSRTNLERQGNLL